MKIIKTFKKIRKEGLPLIMDLIERKIFNVKTNFFNKIKNYFDGKNGLEIGGPSRIFKRGGYIPIYSIAQQVDGCNFNKKTVWEGLIHEGKSYNVGAKCVGHQFITDGVDLSGIKDGTYDFILSSHSLEHIANPIKALKEWLRVLKQNGAILLILPDRRFTFDNKRPVTDLNHLLKDYELRTTEEDLTHLEEILSLHDLAQDEAAGTKLEFKERSLKNFSNRCLHHHVFDLVLLRKILDYLNINIYFDETAPPFHLIIMGIKK